jgi:large subunit ribosomal protein L24
MHVRKNDIVQVIAGEDAGKQGKVLRVDKEKDRIVVQGVNFVWKHLRRSQEYPHGARIQKEAPVAANRVMVVCPNCSKPTRPRVEHPEGKAKARVCRRCQKEVSYTA